MLTAMHVLIGVGGGHAKLLTGGKVMWQAAEKGPGRAVRKGDTEQGNTKTKGHGERSSQYFGSRLNMRHVRLPGLSGGGLLRLAKHDMLRCIGQPHQGVGTATSSMCCRAQAQDVHCVNQTVLLSHVVAVVRC